jgi:hypothetical protein
MSSTSSSVTSRPIRRWSTVSVKVWRRVAIRLHSDPSTSSGSRWVMITRASG